MTIERAFRGGFCQHTVVQLRRIVTRGGLLCALSAWAASCDHAGPPARTPATTTSHGPLAGQRVTILVAASAAAPLERLAHEFGERSGAVVQVSPGASNALAAQIQSGAPADLYLPASVEWMEHVRQTGQVLESTPLLSNALVLVVPKGNPAGVKSLGDLTRESVRFVALAGENVPAGRYAEQAMRSAGVIDALLRQKRIVRGHDVRAALAYVARGEADAGVVYSTDARGVGEVEIVYRFDPKAHDEIVCPLGRLKSARDNSAARGFYEFLKSRESRAVFEEYGFTVR